MRIIKHSFESAFADRVITGPVEHFREDSSLYLCLTTPSPSPFATMQAQCCSARIAERMKRERTIEAMSERDFQRLYDRIDFRHIEIGKTLMLPKITKKSPPWHELRPWLEDTMLGSVSVFLHARETRLSFADDGDYTLARLAWG